MTPHERAYMHLQNAWALFQHVGNQSGNRTALLTANVLSLLERAVDEGDEKTLKAILVISDSFRALMSPPARN